MVEQDCVYQDIDGRDQNSMHIMMHHHESIVAYTRVYEERQAGTWHIGRVVVRKDWRLKGLGKKIMNQSINFLFTKQDVELILISAQEYLLKFYSDFGFEAFGEAYLEDGIPHRAMKLDKKKPQPDNNCGNSHS